MIADLNAQIAKADSSSTIGHLLHLATEVERLSDGVAEYDSSELISTTAEIGAVRYQTDGTMRVYDSAEWRNILTKYEIPSFRGSISGYKSGGSGPSTYNIIDKWSFSSDGNASDVGDQTTARYDTGGHSSSSHGYTSGGYGYYNIIDNFPFASGGNASDVGDLTVARTTVGHSSSESGYSSGGAPNKNVIDKFPFAANGNATDVGDLLGNSWYNAGISSGFDGYNAGGAVPSVSNVIQKFSFSADGNSTDVGDLTVARERPTGTNSDTHGYAAGGHPFSFGAATALTIDKFSFSSGGNATDVGDITNRGSGGTGQSSTVSGYIAGGYGYGSPNYKNIIEKYSFLSDGNATDVGDLTAARYAGAGQQV